MIAETGRTPDGNVWKPARESALGFAPTPQRRKPMMKFTLLGAAALVLSSTLASPIMAQDAPRGHAQKQMRMNPAMHQQRTMASRNDNMARRNTVRRSDDMAYRNDPNSWNNNYAWNDGRRDSGFWPGAVAGGVVGGAVGTAGAIATAPFRGSDSYAYYNPGPNPNSGWSGYNSGWNSQTYAQRNGFVCEPGTWFKGEDGRQHPCQ
jgi:hypothetical protein